ncbi:MAG: hypothetical protein K0R26_636 [Bacteroidota bacterium]|jgi:hypothetical protein|nr:hypothetical protein [Bacteroidota bacterium]
MSRFWLITVVSVCLSVSLLSCKKDKLLTDPSATVQFSQDSILFDTVFTTIGSTTRNIRVINNNNQKINISSVYLEKGAGSAFFLNVDGVPGKTVNDVEILAHDSIYIFVQVNVNPTSALSPLIIEDKILFNINGNVQCVRLEAWGQDAHYHFPDRAIQYKNGFLPYSTVSQSNNVTVTWGGGAVGQPDDNRPHVIYGWLVVDSTQKLIINPGIKVYFHQNAGLWVYRYGTLQVNGALNNEVVFQGDRREADYADMPGQWDRIWINEGHTDNYINYAIIKNSFIGIQASILLDPNPPRRLKITNTIVKNCSKWGLYTQYFEVWSANSVFANCKEYCAALSWGGKYTFLHTTFANYYSQEGGRGGQPAVHIDNYDGSTSWPMDSVYFANSIIEGSQSSEIEMDVRPYTPAPKCKFSNSLIRGALPTNTFVTNFGNVFNGNSGFDNPASYNFKLKSGSSAKNLGDGAVVSSYTSILGTDILGAPRPTGSVSAGAYQ